ncbi:MAG: shikimate dehydrogenase [Ornithinimicrobium sp.]
MTAEVGKGTRRAGVVGSPIEHSLSPLLHEAAYRALGLRQWSYHRDEVAAGALAAYVRDLPDSWVGLSVTMPGKEEALALATQTTERAELTGAANTLVRQAGGWWADNTDVDGVTRALAEAGCGHVDTAWVVGSGATARSVLVALGAMGVSQVCLQVRSHARGATLALVDSLGMGVDVRGYDQGWPRLEQFDVAVSTVPAQGALPSDQAHAGAPGSSCRLGRDLWAMDVVYQADGPWARRLRAAGAVTVPGAEMLLHQAAQQVQAMTGHPAPVEAMRRALAAGRADLHS